MYDDPIEPGGASGGGTQYTEGSIDVLITGTAMMFEVDEVTHEVGVVNATNKLPVNVLSIVKDGQQLANNSIPVVLASDQSALYVYLRDAADNNPFDASGILTVDGEVTVGGTVIVDGSGSTQPVSNAGLTALNGAIAGTEVQVDVLTMPTVAVTQSGVWDEVGINDSGNSITVDNGGTFAVQVDGAALTSLQLIDDVVYTDDTSTHATGTSKGILMMAAATPTDGSVNANDIGAVAMTTDRRLLVDASGVAVPITDNSGSITVDYATTGSGTATGAIRVELPTNGTGVVGLNAGTNAIGKLVANSGVDIGDVTLTAGTAAIGTLLPPDIDVTANTNYTKKYYTNAGAVTDGIIWSPAGGKRWHIHTIYINVSAAATVTLEDDKAGGDEAIWKGEIAANSGVVLTFPEKYPWSSGEDAADLIITTSAGNVYVTVSGYEI